MNKKLTNTLTFILLGYFLTGCMSLAPTVPNKKPGNKLLIRMLPGARFLEFKSLHEIIQANQYVYAGELAANVKTSPLYWGVQYYWQHVKPNIDLRKIGNHYNHEPVVLTVKDPAAWDGFEQYYLGLDLNHLKELGNSSAWLSSMNRLAYGYFSSSVAWKPKPAPLMWDDMAQAYQSIVIDRNKTSARSVHLTLVRRFIKKFRKEYQRDIFDHYYYVTPNANENSYQFADCHQFGIKNRYAEKDLLDYAATVVIRNPNAHRDIFKCRTGVDNPTVDINTWTLYGITQSAMYVTSEPYKGYSLGHSEMMPFYNDSVTGFQYYTQVRYQLPRGQTLAFLERSTSDPKQYSLYIGEKYLLIEFPLTKSRLKRLDVHYHKMAVEFQSRLRTLTAGDSPHAEFDYLNLPSTMQDFDLNEQRSKKFVDVRKRLNHYSLQLQSIRLDDWAELNGWDVELYGSDNENPTLGKYYSLFTLKDRKMWDYRHLSASTPSSIHRDCDICLSDEDIDEYFEKRRAYYEVLWKKKVAQKQ